MNKIALTIGINLYDPKVYGTKATLRGCVNDSNYMKSLAFANGYKTTQFTNKQATRASILSWVRAAVKTSLPGDFVLMSQSSHGTRTTMQGKEVNGICMHDNILWDFELKAEFSKFRKGVNVIWVTDNCYAENNFRFLLQQDGTVKFMDFSTLKGINLPKSVQWLGAVDFKCNFIQYASSTSFQVSYDLGSGGLFTESLKKAVIANKDANYYKIFQETEKIISKTGYPQNPRFVVINGNDIKPNGLTYNKFLN